MKIRTFVVCAALGVGASLSVRAEQVIVAPSQGGGTAGFTIRPVQSGVVKGQPYSADVATESIQSLSDGNRIVQRSTGRVFRDVEGRTRREDDRPSGEPIISISDPVANMSWTLNPANKTAVEMPNLNLSSFVVQLDNVAKRIIGSTDPQSTGRAGARGGGGAGAGGGRGAGVASAPATTTVLTFARSGGAGGRGGRGAGPNADRVEEPLPNKSIENLLCTGVRRTTTIAKGAIGNEQPIKIVSEEWTSIDLQVLVLTDLNDPRTGHSTYKLTNVRRADPDLSLFKVPADYAITRAGGGRGRGGN